MPPNTKYALLGYSVAGLNASCLTLIFGWGGNAGVLTLVVMAVTLMSWFYWMHRVGLYEETSTTLQGESQSHRS